MGDQGTDAALRALMIRLARKDLEESSKSPLVSKAAKAMIGLAGTTAAYTIWSGALASVLRYLGMSIPGAIAAGLLAGIPIVLTAVCIHGQRSIRRDTQRDLAASERTNGRVLDLIQGIIERQEKLGDRSEAMSHPAEPVATEKTGLAGLIAQAALVRSGEKNSP